MMSNEALTGLAIVGIGLFVVILVLIAIYVVVEVRRFVRTFLTPAFGPEADQHIEAMIRELARTGQTAEAVGLYQKLKRVGRAEAQAAVEAIARGSGSTD